MDRTVVAIGMVVALAGGAMGQGDGARRDRPNSPPWLDRGGPGVASPRVPKRAAEGPATTSDEASGGSSATIATADDLLRALETSDRGLETLACEVEWTKAWSDGGNPHIRKGRLYYEDKALAVAPAGNGAPPAGPRVRKFAAVFEELWTGPRLEKEPKHYVFDGEWLVEKEPSAKRMVRQRLDRTRDPMKLGEGPIPLPVGQKREDILARFECQLLAPEDGLSDEAIRLFVAGSYQLRLTPKPGVESIGQTSEIRLWYVERGKGSLIPRMAMATDRAENVSTVRLVGVRLNEAIAEAFDTSAPPGWDVQVRQP